MNGFRSGEPFKGYAFFRCIGCFAAGPRHIGVVTAVQACDGVGTLTHGGTDTIHCRITAADHDVLILSELTALGEDLQAQLLKTVCRLLGPSTVAYSIFGDHGAFCQGFNWLLTWDPSFEIEELEVLDRLGTHEDETLYMYKITRPNPGLTAAEILELAAG